MLAARLNDLKRKSFSELRRLPQSSSVDSKDDQGRRVQVVTWCDQISPVECRVVVSVHHVHGLGVSSVLEAEGFLIDQFGAITGIDEAEARALLR